MSDEVRATGDVLWTSAEAAAATGGRAFGRWWASGVSIDSRETGPGDLFVALIDRRDGHAYVPSAMEAGAAAALVDRRSGDEPSLVVPDTLEGLRGLGRAARERSPALRVAVTGSVGKTSVKEMVYAMLARAGAAHRSIRSFNNHWGVPLTLARMPRASERAVFEMGMNHAGEIRPLSQLVRPHVAVITKIAPAHIENLGSLEAIADAKAEIFEGLEHWGAAVIPGDDDFAERLASRAGAAGAGWLVRAGTDAGVEARLTAFEVDAEGARGTAEVFGRTVSFRLKTRGQHWGLNAVMAMAAAYLVETPLDACVEALATFAIPDGRGAAHLVETPNGPLTVLDDSYNANPASVRAALAALGAETPPGRRIAALGPMLELGDHAAAEHRDLAEVIEAARVDAVYLVGEETRVLHDALPDSRRAGWWADSAACAQALKDAAQGGDVVLVKGSNAAGMKRVVDVLVNRAS